MTAVDRVEKQIEKARKLLNPPKIDYSTVPPWIRQQVKDAIRRGDLPGGGPRVEWSGTANEAFEHAIEHFGGGWVDHWGRMRLRGKQILTSEPYAERLTPVALDQLKQFCEVLGLGFSFWGNSNHYPGRTLLIMISPLDGREVTGLERRERPKCRKIILELMETHGMTLQELLDSNMLGGGLPVQARKMLAEQQA
jgi:hypothetical protein